MYKEPGGLATGILPSTRTLKMDNDILSTRTNLWAEENNNLRIEISKLRQEKDESN